MSSVSSIVYILGAQICFLLADVFARLHMPRHGWSITLLYDSNFWLGMVFRVAGTMLFFSIITHQPLGRTILLLSISGVLLAQAMSTFYLQEPFELKTGLAMLMLIGALGLLHK